MRYDDLYAAAQQEQFIGAAWLLCGTKSLLGHPFPGLGCD
jgi:hypothetical protein